MFELWVYISSIVLGLCVTFNGVKMMVRCLKD